ncbi:unnamed protein product [Bursaphelenchus xylophilus]|uniref:(pine wood nematode) hypothetical protein n=1 Tax=Bursaphelenchus xylophilus TaxID=6326 RepID=A0A1I7S4K0_BURXY|nr:unnamed protein product [Bursaphelenchus xylophilus]CAG9117182.1 unnamed protein product [Bursaphelenchus xylophilus]
MRFSLTVVQVFRILNGIEIAAACVNTICSVYFVARTINLSTLNINLRLILMVETILCVFVSLVHSTSQITDESWYSIEKRQYLAALIFYVTLLAAQVAAFMFDAKYMLIAIERTIAFEDRRRYETRGGEVARKYLWRTFFVVTTLTVLKCIIIYCKNPQLQIDARLRRTLILEYDYDWAGPSYFCAWLAIPYSIYKFYKLHQMTNKNTAFESLSAMYEVRRIRMTLDYMKRLISVFVGTLLFCGFVTFLQWYFHNIKKVADYSYEMRCTSSLVYTSFSIYNLICTYYLVHEFPQFQRIVHRDFRILRRNYVEAAPLPTTDRNQTELYFKQFSAMWNK